MNTKQCTACHYIDLKSRDLNNSICGYTGENVFETRKDDTKCGLAGRFFQPIGAFNKCGKIFKIVRTIQASYETPNHHEREVNSYMVENDVEIISSGVVRLDSDLTVYTTALIIKKQV
jgi:hypothetical protein